MKVAIIGMGYVGATLAGALARTGVHEVFGVDPDPRDFHEPGLAEARKSVTEVLTLSHVPPCEAYVLCVGTPLGSDEALRRATREIATHMRDGALVIVRSTVPIGTTRKVIVPLLQGSDLLHFQVAVCPERTVEGQALWELNQLPQIIGVETPEALRLTQSLFAPMVGERVLVPSYETAEMAKLLANSWRDVTFAYANEVALLAEREGVSAREAIEAANFNYPRCVIPMPGPVGGPCLVKDSYLLTEYRRGGVIMAARDLNERLVSRIARNLGRLVNQRLPNRANIEVALLGTAFKGQPETDDTRDSPALALRDALVKFGWHVTTVDPAAPADLRPAQWPRDGEGFDAVIVATNAPVWRTMDLRGALAPSGFIYDCCGGVDDFDHRFGG